MSSDAGSIPAASIRNFLEIDKPKKKISNFSPIPPAFPLLLLLLSKTTFLEAFYQGISEVWPRDHWLIFCVFL
jgi:hypothetical protein